MAEKDIAWYEEALESLVRSHAQVAQAYLAAKEAARPTLGKGPNKRVGFFHNHSGMAECGMAYRAEVGWEPCRKYVNHDGECGYENNTAF